MRLTSITQYYPNPLFRKSGAQHRQTGNGTMTYEAGDEHRLLQLSSADETGMQCSLSLHGLPKGTPMTFGITAFVPSDATSFRNGGLVTIGYGSWTTIAVVGQNFASHLGQTADYRSSFTIPADADTLAIIFNSPSVAGKSVTFDNPKFMTKDDWDRYQAMEDKPSRIYWDLMPLTRG